MYGGSSASDSNKPSDPAPLEHVRGSPITGETSAAHVAVEHNRRRAICLAVDDFGLHAGINQAALRLADMGHVRAIGCMVGGAAWATGNPLLRRLEPRQIDVGLHLDLTESPLLSWTARPLTTLIRDSFLHRLDRRTVRSQIRAQLDAFEQSVGRGPAYIDGHQHVHQLPIVRSELLEELGDRYGWFKPWLRSARTFREPREVQSFARRDMLKPWVIEQLGARGLARMARRMGYPQNGHLLGVYDFRGGTQRYRRLLAGWLAVARDGDLLMTHPSLPAHDEDPLINTRSTEFLVLSDPAFTTQLREARLEVQPMSRILGRGGLPDPP